MGFREGSSSLKEQLSCVEVGRGTHRAAVLRIKILWQAQDEAREVEKDQTVQDLTQDFGLYNKSNEKYS